jgi:fatty acid desaturase
MSSPLTPDALEELARKRAGAKLGWYIHATVYVLVNLVIFSMSHYAYGNRPWSLGPLLGWGIGLVLHGVSVFVLGSGSGLRERMVQRERERIARTQRDL